MVCVAVHMEGVGMCEARDGGGLDASSHARMLPLSYSLTPHTSRKPNDRSSSSGSASTATPLPFPSPPQQPGSSSCSNNGSGSSDSFHGVYDCFPCNRVLVGEAVDWPASKWGLNKYEDKDTAAWTVHSQKRHVGMYTPYPIFTYPVHTASPAPSTTRVAPPPRSPAASFLPFPLRRVKNTGASGCGRRY